MPIKSKRKKFELERHTRLMEVLSQHTQDFTLQKLHLVEQIIDAFWDVELEDGIGMYEADCIDDYATFDEQDFWRKKDERRHWYNMLLLGFQEKYPERFRPSSAFTFMDAKGRRFALPYYLLWDLLGANHWVHLDYILGNDYYMSSLDLTHKQQQVILEYIKFNISLDKNQYDEWQDTLKYLNQLWHPNKIN